MTRSGEGSEQGGHLQGAAECLPAERVLQRLLRWVG